MALNLLDLRSELETDPSALGYTGDDVTDADIINLARASIQLRREAIPMREIYAQVDWDGDFIGLSAANGDGFAVLTQTPDLDASSQNVADAFVGLFGAGSETVTNLLGIIDRDGSRAEELFGHGTIVTPSDIARARVAV